MTGNICYHWIFQNINQLSKTSCVMLRGPCAVWREASRHAFVTVTKLSLLLPRRMVLTRRAASCRAEKSIIRWLQRDPEGRDVGSCSPRSSLAFRALTRVAYGSTGPGYGYGPVRKAIKQLFITGRVNP
jgi:hypothetical protein